MERLKLTKDIKEIFKNGAHQFAIHQDSKHYYCTSCEKTKVKTKKYNNSKDWFQCTCKSHVKKISYNKLMEISQSPVLVQYNGMVSGKRFLIWCTNIKYDMDMKPIFQEPKIIGWEDDYGKAMCTKPNYLCWGDFRFNYYEDNWVKITNSSRRYVKVLFDTRSCAILGNEILNTKFKYIKSFARNNKRFSIHALVNKDERIIEKLLKNCDKRYLEYYIDDNFNILQFNRSEIRFIQEKKLDLKELKYFKDMKSITGSRSLNIEKFKKFVEKEEYNKSEKGRIKAMNDSFNWLEKEVDNYKLILPKNAKDFDNEGSKLNHCVGGYSTKVSDKKCILFVRKKENSPLYTAEIRKEKDKLQVVQFRGTNNKEAPKHVLDLLKKELLLHNT